MPTSVAFGGAWKAKTFAEVERVSWQTTRQLLPLFVTVQLMGAVRSNRMTSPPARHVVVAVFVASAEAEIEVAGDPETETW